MVVTGFEYIGTICNQIACEDFIKNQHFNEYWIEIAGLNGFFHIKVPKNEEQALIGANFAFCINPTNYEIYKYKINGYEDMDKEKIELPEWQKGSKSKTSSIDKVFYHNEWLKKMHTDIKNKIKKSNLNEEKDEALLGFPED